MGEGSQIENIHSRDNHIPEKLYFKPPFPNPFNAFTTLEFGLPANDYITLTIFDCQGRKKAELINEEAVAGRHSIEWHCKGYSSGVYFARFTSINEIIIRKMSLLR